MTLNLQNIVANPEKFLIKLPSLNQKSVLEKTASKLLRNTETLIQLILLILKKYF